VQSFVNYVEINQLNALNYILIIFLLRWFQHVLAKQCHAQGVTMFLSEPLQRQYGRSTQLHATYGSLVLLLCRTLRRDELKS
jgi:hypothetical protein